MVENTIGVYVENPEIFRLLVRKLKEKGICFTLDFNVEEPGVHLVITDSPWKIKGKVKILVVRNCDEVEYVIERAVLATKGALAFNSLLIGVDPGENMGFAVIGDGVFIKGRIFRKIKDLIREIENTMNNLLFIKCKIKVGSRSRYSEKILTEVKPATYSFIGTTTPYRVMDKVIAAILKLLAKAFNLGSQVIIINTDGWFKGRKAVEAKLQTIFHVKPHVVFIIKKENCVNEADMLFNYLNRFNINTIVIESPKDIKERSISERRSIREYLYSKYFYGAKIVDLDLKNLVIMNLDVLKGKFLSHEEKEVLKEVLSLKPDMEILHATMVNNNLIAVVKGGTVIVDSNVLRNIKETYGQIRLKVLSENWEKGLVVSILNENLEEAGIGYIEKINFEKGIVRIRTNYEGEICGLIVGNIRLMYDEKTHTVREWGKWSL